jgi:hypothetical protein
MSDTFQLRSSPHGTTAWIIPAYLLPAGFTAEAEVTVQMPLAKPFGGDIDIGNSNVGSFPPKQIFGDFNRSSHQVLSSFVQQSWAGGGQKTDSQESSDTDRYAFLASLETRFPRKLTLLPLTRVIEGPNETGARILGDLKVGGNRQTYVSYGLEIHRISSDTSVSIDTLPASPVAPGVTFRGSGSTLMYIPCGGSGYCTFDGTNASTIITTVEPISLVVHDKKLWSIDIDGNINKSTDGTAWTLVATIEDEYLPRGLVMGMDRTDAPVPHAVTDSMTFAVDETNSTVVETELNYAPHPYSGLAFERWRTDIYVAIGLGVQRYTRGTVNAVGLDRDDGVGPEFSGYISAMRRSFNDLFLGVSAAPVAAGVLSEIETDVGEEVYLSGSSARCSLNRINGAGVPHTSWVAPEIGGVIRDVYVSTAQGAYRVYWSWKGRVYFQNVSTDFDNPALNPTAEFEESGALTGSWLDMGMAVDHMTLASIELEVLEASDDEQITIQYQVNRDDLTEQWRHLADITEPGHYELQVGLNGTLPDGQTRYDGIGFRRMRYRVLMSRGENVNHKPVVEAIVITFLKRMRILKSYDFIIDCESKDGGGATWGLGNRERAEVLDNLIQAGEWIPFTYNDRWHMVRVAYSNGRDKTGQDLRGNRSVSVIVPWEQALPGSG